MDFYEDRSVSDDSADKRETDVGPHWLEQLAAAQKVFDKWQSRSKKIVKRYRDDRDASEHARAKFNILWSNIQVLSPALYGRMAQPEVSRRYQDNDVVGRLASTILERVLEYEVTQFTDYDTSMRQSVEDRLLSGRGVSWVRYEPVIVDQNTFSENSERMSEENNSNGQITDDVEGMYETIESVHTPVDYVYWQDFLHSPARTWEEVTWVARYVYMSKKEGIQRFGDVFKNVPLQDEPGDFDSKMSAGQQAVMKRKAKVAEIWDKNSCSVIWVAKGYSQSLDVRKDPLQLESFFPCPKPLYATLTNGSLIPVPDYCEYADQAQELDDLTNRISKLVQTIKAIGVFNAEYKELGRLFTEGIDNKLFPVTSWGALSEKGGLRGAIEMMDLSTQISALQQLYQARELVKQTIYEISGISDILRGSSAPQETLGAQQLKANFGSLRMKSSQEDVARFAAEVFRLKAQIICRFYPPELMVAMSGILNTDDGKDQRLVSAALQLLRNSSVRDFHIAVSSDTLAQIDDQAEKAGAVEAIQAIATFLQQAIPMVSQAPETLPMASSMLLFLVRRFRAGRELESSIEQAMQALEKKAGAAMGQPDKETQKEQIKGQLEQARAQMDVQLEQIKGQTTAQIERMRIDADLQRENAKLVANSQMEQQRLQFEKWKAELEASTKITIAKMTHPPQMLNDVMAINGGNGQVV